MRWVGHVAWTGASRYSYWILMGKPEWKRLLERPRCWWEDYIKMDLQDVGWGCI